MKMVKFDGLFAFVYSDRPNAPAVQFKNKISEEEKRKRLQILLQLQENFTRILRHRASETRIKYKDTWNFERLDRQGRNMLNFWLQSFRRNYGAIISLEVEKEFIVPLPDPETWEPTGYAIKGIIDFIAHMKTVPKNYYDLDEISDRFIKDSYILFTGFYIRTTVIIRCQCNGI